MNFDTEFKKYLLSDDNITYHTNLLLEVCNIKRDNLDKIRILLQNMITSIIPNLSNLPTNQQEFIEALNFTRNFIHQKFIKFLQEKYPDKQIIKTKPEPVLIEDVSVNQLNQLNQASQPIQFVNSNNQQSQPPRKTVEYLSEAEKDLLLKKYGLGNKQKDSKNTQQEFIKYLTNPTVLKNFWDMVQRMNPNASVIKKSYRADMILNKDQFDLYLAKVMSESNKKEKIQQIAQQTQLPQQLPQQSESSELPDNTEEEITIPTIDISKGINTDNMESVSKVVKELSEMKLKYKNDKDIIEAVDEELNTLVSALKKYRESIKNVMTNYDNQIKVINDKNENEEILKLEINPNEDGSDMKKIEINVSDNRKIKKVTLLDYYIPSNVANITRYTNHFGIFTSGQAKNIYIPPAKYDDINSVINFIKGSISFLEFKIENNIVTITNLLGKFDLIINEKSIFLLLGFREKSEKYRGETSYSGSVPYDLNINSIVYFSMHSASVDPIELIFDKETISNTVVKKSNTGVSMKKIAMEFVNKTGQTYDFILPIRIGLKVEFAN